MFHWNESKILQVDDVKSFSRRYYHPCPKRIEEELQDEEGCENYTIPIDKKGAQYFLTLNPREPKY